LADENRLWGAPRIHGELLKLANCRLGTHGVALPAWAAEDTIADMVHIPGESPRPGCIHLGAPVTGRVGRWRRRRPCWGGARECRAALATCVAAMLGGRLARVGSTLRYRRRFRPRSPSPPHGHAEENRPQPAIGCPFDAPRAVLRPVGNGRVPPRLCETIRLHIATSRSPVASLCLRHWIRQHDRSDAGLRVCV